MRIGQLPEQTAPMTTASVPVDDGTTTERVTIKTLLSGTLRIVGDIDASSNPAYPEANAGDGYRVSTPGKVGGASGTTCEVGDLLVCTVNGSLSGDQASVGANWVIILGAR